MSEPATEALEPGTTLPESDLIEPELTDEALNRAALDALRAAPPPAEPPAPPPEAPASQELPNATGPVTSGESAPAPTSEPAPSTPAPAPAVDPLEARMAAYIERQAAEQRARQEAAEEARAERAAREAAQAELEALKRRLAEAPLDVVKELAGFDLESLNRHAVSGRTPEAVALQRMQARLAEFERREQERDAAAAAAEQARVQQEAQQRMVSEVIPQALRADAAKFPKLLKAYDEVEVNQMVFNLMASEARRAQSNPGSGARVPTPSEAAAALEAQLVARLKRLEPTVTGNPAPTEGKQPGQNPSPSAPRGLTNALTPVTPPPADEDDDLSDEALDRKAIALIKSNGARK